MATAGIICAMRKNFENGLAIISPLLFLFAFVSSCFNFIARFPLLIVHAECRLIGLSMGVIRSVDPIKQRERRLVRLAVRVVGWINRVKYRENSLIRFARCWIQYIR